MSAFVCLLLCALLGAVCDGSLVKRESSPERQYSPCYVNGTWYADGDSIPDPCNFCFCADGHQTCALWLCYDIEGDLFPTPPNFTLLQTEP